MMKSILGLAAIAVLVGCSTMPSDPKPDAHRYAVQIIEVEGPLPSSDALNNSFVFKNSDCYEYPISYAEIGVALTNDQTEAISLPEDYRVVDGVVIAEEKTYPLGCFIELLIHRVEQDKVSCYLTFSRQVLKGFDEYVMVDGEKAQMPVLSKHQFTSDLNVPLNVWTALGGLPGTWGAHEQHSNHNPHFAVRIIPPQSLD